MQVSLIILISLFFSISAYSNNWKQLKLVNGCRIHAMAGYMERAFPGSICIFLDNGNFISASETAIRMINPKNEIVWEHKGHFHHQVNLSNDKTKIFALSSRIDNDLREDTFLIFDLYGRILFTQKASELYRLSGMKALNWRMQPLNLNGVTSSKEFSHFNSFYDVPALNKKDLPFWLKEGNIILNTQESGIFILTPDMKELLHHIIIKGSSFHRIHDVQVKANGNFLFFNNLVEAGLTKPYFLIGYDLTNHHSAVQEVDPVTFQIIHEFTANPKTIFYSWICGSIQEIDNDLWLFTHFLTGTYIYSKSKKDFVASIPGTHADNQRFGPVQQVKAQDLSKFMSHWP